MACATPRLRRKQHKALHPGYSEAKNRGKGASMPPAAGLARYRALIRASAALGSGRGSGRIEGLARLFQDAVQRLNQKPCDVAVRLWPGDGCRRLRL